MMTANILGLDIFNLNMKETIKRIEYFLEKKEKYYCVFTPNVDMTMISLKDVNLKKSLLGADILVADGMPLVWASKLFGKPLKEKIDGSDLFFNFCELASKKGYRIFLMGAKEGVALRASEILQEKYKGLNIVGTYSPPFGFEKSIDENEKIVKMLKKSEADVLFVGLSEGKGEKWIFQNKDIYKIPLSIQVGATFDFAAGDKKMAPQYVKKIGFAWLWRLIQEPKRLWRRYLIDDMRFFYLIFLQKFTNRFNN